MGVFRQAGQWLAALVLAALLCNAGLWLYHDPAVWIPRENGATDAIWHPGARLVMGTEGRGVHRVDSRGYLNPDKPLAEGYVLVVGSSFTQGKEVTAGTRFVDVLNEKLAESEDTLAVYSVSQDGFYLPDMLRCAPALLAEFPDAATLVIETGTTAFSEEDLATAGKPCTPDAAARGPALMARLSAGEKLALHLKEVLPVLTLAKAQLTAMIRESAVAASAAASDESLKTALGRLRRQFEGEILVLYHPPVEITPAGMAVTAEESTPAFRAACEDWDITVLDTSDAFLVAYEADFTVPYGFYNTTPGSGHLNAHGHRICAEVLLEALKGGAVG